jgi:hypothetical protein
MNVVGLTVAMQAFGGDGGSDGIGVRAAAQFGAVRDDLVVPLGFGGVGFRVGGHYGGTAPLGWWSARLELGARYVVERYGHPGYVVDYGAEVRWPFQLGHGRWFAGLGPALAWDTRMNRLESWDNAHGFWLASEWLGPAVRARGPVGNDWDIEVTSAVALVGFASRPPELQEHLQDPVDRVSYYLFVPFEDQQFVTVADLQVVRAEVALHPPRRPGAGGAWSFGSDVRFARYDDLAPVVDVSFTTWVGRAWR